MNNRQNGRRRGRGGQQARNGQPGSQDRGSRIDNRSRGNAAQLLEKYKTLARDAQMQGDRVNTEYYLQFADHYFRVLSENRARFEEQRRPREDYRDEDGGDEDGNEAPRGYQRSDFSTDDDWSNDEPERAEVAAEPQPQQNSRPPREPRPPRQEPRQEARSDEGAGERRRERPRRNGNGNAAPAQESGMNDEREATEAPSRIEIDLPPSISMDRAPSGETSEAEGEGEAAKPRRRTRRPRAEAAPVEV